jgi:hypothetical protein
LEIDLRRQTAALAARRVAFDSDACRTMPLECARAAVEMYRTRRTIEDIEDALGRIDMITQARSCAACSPASNSRAGRGAGLPLGSDLGVPQTGSWSG